MYQKIRISTEEQNHIKIGKIESEIGKIVSQIRDALKTIINSEEKSGNISRIINSSAAKIFIYSSLPKAFEFPEKIRELIEKFEKFKENIHKYDGMLYYQACRDSINSIEKLFIDLKGNRLYGIMVDFLNKLNEKIISEFESSDLHKTPSIDVSIIDRKYPLSDKGARFNIGLLIKNRGDGLAKDVNISIVETAGIKFENLSHMISSVVAREDSSLHFSAISENIGSEAMFEIEVRYSNLKGEQYEDKKIFEITGQNDNIEWDKIKTKDPYSILPVTNERDLVGRSSSIDALIALINSESLGSALIYGQKRVGKTSIAKTFMNKANSLKQGICYVYMDVGIAGTGKEGGTIDGLCNHIRREILKKCREYESIQIDHFNGSLSPLANYIGDIEYHNPDFKICIILDEFDELSYSTYAGEYGNAFFQNIRSMTSNGNCSFILVGGEKMKKIITNYGAKLNKFTSIIVDYFDRKKQWDDYVALVKKPSSEVLEFSDSAINLLYDITAGNPYFTKMICRAIYQNALNRRDSYIGNEEVQSAYGSVKSEEGTQAFAHFWSDGLLSSIDQALSMQYKRKCVLIAIGKQLRISSILTIDGIKDNIPDSNIYDIDIATTVNEFESRNILCESDGNYSIKVKLFEDWLTDRGISEIIIDTPEREELLKLQKFEEGLRITDTDIENLLEGWPNYKDRSINLQNIRKWLNQFDTVLEQKNIFAMLKKIEVISQMSIRDWCREAFMHIKRNTPNLTERDSSKARRDEYLVGFLDGLTKSGSRVSNLFVEENKIKAANLVDKDSLEKSIDSNDNIQVMILVDNFVGTGNTISNSIEKLPKSLIKKIILRKIKVYIIVFLAESEGIIKIEEKIDELGFCGEVWVKKRMLTSDYLLTEDSRLLTNKALRASVRDILIKYGERIGLDPFGYGSSGLAIVFDSNCPNNTIPILWASKNDWFPLFNRT